jgi:hypothetical protein
MASASLPGLDGSNPLGFLAALGALRILEDLWTPDAERPLLSWKDVGTWVPLVHGVGSVSAMCDAVLEDRETWREDPLLDLSYTNLKGNIVADLKPHPDVFRGWLEKLASHSERASACAGALGSEVVQYRSGMTKPTALHFTAGQQAFVGMIRELRDGFKEGDLLEALKGPWIGDSKLPTMSWDATSARDYALRARNPSSEKRGSVAGANWLAFRALPFFPVAPRGHALETTGFRGGWHGQTFRWPLWSQPCSADTIRSLLLRPMLEAESPAARRALGIEVVFQSTVERSDPGGYGCFRPARVI